MGTAMLPWISLFQSQMGSATDGGVSMREGASVDPLKKFIYVTFRDPIPNRTCWVAFQIIAYAFAAANDCAVQRISKTAPANYVVEVSIKRRNNQQAKDPFTDDWKSNSRKRKEEFQKYLRDKAKELEEDDSYVPEPTSPLPPNVNQWR